MSRRVDTPPDEEPEEPREDLPQLWHPNAAANWSILFTPVFGAVLHMQNWRALGEPERAKTNKVWAVITAVYAAVVIISIFGPQHPAIDRVFQAGWLGLLFGWYFSQGRPQARYVKQQLGNEYRRRGWTTPLLAGFTCFLTYLAVINVLFELTFAYTAEELEREQPPLVQADLQRDPDVSRARVIAIDLEEIGDGMFSGTVDARINGEAIQYGIGVDATQDGVMWWIE
ncbi:MAG: hypothetical protein AAGB26_15365 [Planctomycetota bacterium]